ncbi:response regulator transcription factor [Chloroflexi bacterium TSY]|nr:response regulator transcription factor [Chloroflexi bacterium TSY]
MNKIRVLLIDDHPIVRSGIRVLLEQAGDIVVVGESDRGHDALDLVKQLMPDILLLDMEMPGKSGVEIARELKEAQLPIRVLGLSAYDDDQYIMNLLSSGAAGYLTKEEALETIVDAVRGVARGEEGWLSRRAAASMAASTRQETRNHIQLTAREEEVLNLLAEGWTNNRIASELHLSERTVRFHLTNIYDKVGVSTRAEAIRWALTEHK